MNNYIEILYYCVTWLDSSVGRAFSLNFTFSITFLSKFTDPFCWHLIGDFPHENFFNKLFTESSTKLFLRCSLKNITYS